jgi:DNA-binding beta-propeller fold protein YncE
MAHSTTKSGLLSIVTATVAYTVACAVLISTASAQSKSDAKHLDALLKQLAGMDPAAWKAKLKALEAAVAAHENRARALQKQSAVAKARAAAARGEADRFKKVMTLLARTTPLRAPAKKAPAKKATPKKAVAKKAVAKAAPKKAPAGKPIAKKTPAKKPPAKKATPKKATPKKAPAKKSPAPKTPAPQPSGEWITYADHVQEIFMENCSACHDADEKEGGLDLTSFATARAGGSSGTTIVPGDIDQSRLYQLVAHLQRPTMPPDEPPIDKKHVDTIRRWILAGAPESKADALTFAAKTKASTQKAVVLQPKFDSPAPMPKGWAKVAPAQVARAVAVRTLAASARSSLVAMPGQGQVFVYNSANRQPIGILPFAHGDVEVLAFSADGGRLLVAGGIPGKRGRVVLYNVADGRIVGTFGKEFDTVIAAAVHPQLTHIALGGSNKEVRVYDTSTGALAYEIEEHNEWVLGVDFSSDGEFLVSGDRAGAIVLSDAKTGKNVDVIRRHRGPVHAVKFAPDGRTYATVGADRTLRLFSVKGARQITQRATGSPTMAVAYSPDGKMIAVGCQDGRPRVYRSNGTPLSTLAAVGDWIYSVAFDRDNKTVFAGDWNGGTSVFDLKTRKRVALLTPSAPQPIRN